MTTRTTGNGNDRSSGPADLSADHVVRAGGWHPDYADVLAIATDDDVAVALVAGNGLGYEMELEMWRWTTGSWRPSFSFGLPPHAEDTFASGGAEDCVFAAGVLASPSSRHVLLAYGDAIEEVPVGPSGGWAWIARADALRIGGKPEVVVA